MPVKQYQISELRDYKTFIDTKHRQRLDDLITLYRERKIPTHALATKIAKNLAGINGTPKTAIKLMEKYYDVSTAKDRNTQVAKQNQLKTYFVKGKVNTTTTYSSTTNQEAKKVVINHKDSYKDAKQIKARSEAEARKMFDAMATQDFELKGYSKDVVVNDVDFFSVVDAATYKAGKEGDVLMKAVKLPKYHFIPSDDKLLLSEGFCVVDQFVGIYGPKIN